MADQSPDIEAAEKIDLRDPLLAAFLALLWPGLGHLYQRRVAKGVLFMVCILGTYFYGWSLGGQKVVYASWRPGDRRWPFLCQVWVGVPAWPALIQSAFDPPPFGDDFMTKPDLQRIPIENGPNEFDLWHRELSSRFELGTVFTMVAGLLNVLAIFDAAGGPLVVVPKDRKKGKDEKQKDKDEEDKTPKEPSGTAPKEAPASSD